MKPVRLALTNAAEDLPRLIHGSGKCAHGSFAIVLRPLQGEGLLGLITNDNEGFVWRGGPRLDAPGVPREAIAPEALIQAVQAAQKKLGAQGAVSLRAQWSATFVCDDLTPSVVLTRKVSAYATLTVQSGPQGWTWRVARSAKWFTPEGDATGEALRLSDAVASGLAAAMGLVKEACVVKDTQRRAARDAEYAVSHPLKLAAEPKTDPLARFKPPKGQARPGRPPKSVEAPGGAPAPTTATAVEAKAAEVKEEADGLDAALSGVSPLWAENDAPERIVRWLTDQGLYGLAELVAEGPQAQGFEGWLELLHERALAETPAALTQAVRDVLDGLKTAWETYPALFERARCLLRTAANLASSAPCQGPERAEAIRLVNEAAAEYERARAQLFTTSDATTRRMLRQAVSRAALGAAKAAKACAKAPKVTRQPGASREAERLLKSMVGYTDMFTTKPTGAVGKQWVLQALGNLGLPVHSIDSKKRDGKLSVSVTLTASAAQSPNVTKRLKTLLDALALPGAPALNLERWDFESPPTPTLVAPAPVVAPGPAAASAPARAPRGQRPSLTLVNNPPPAPPPAPAPAPVTTASLPGEEPVDPAKDKLLLDGIKGVLSDLLGPQSPAPMGSP